MAAPTYVKVSIGATDAAGAWTYTGPAPGAAGRMLVLLILQRGTTAGAVTLTSTTNVEDLAGTDNVWTAAAVNQAVSTGSLLHIYLARSLSTTAPVITGGNSTSEDVFVRIYEFQDVSTGTTLATVIENGSAGSSANAVGTTQAVGDVGVTTLGSDRLALNMLAVGAVTTKATFTGQSGGTWAAAGSLYGSSSGLTGSLHMETAAMASAGTINGGSGNLHAAGLEWGVVGFALIGTTGGGGGPTEDPFPYVAGGYYPSEG